MGDSAQTDRRGLGVAGKENSGWSLDRPSRNALRVESRHRLSLPRPINALLRSSAGENRFIHLDLPVASYVGERLQYPAWPLDFDAVSHEAITRSKMNARVARG